MIPIVTARHDAMAILVDGHVIEDVGIEFEAIASFADAERRITGLVIEDGIYVKPMFAAAERVAIIGINRRSWRIGIVVQLAGDLGARTVVGCGVDANDA